MANQSRELHPDVVRFIEERIDSVPHLEALMLLWENGARRWRTTEIAARLYVRPHRARAILEDLIERGLVRADNEAGPVYHAYDGAWDQDGTQMKQVAAAYRKQLVLVAELIHSRGSGAVRDFARAFRIKRKKKE